MDHLGRARFILRSYEKKLYTLNTVLRESYRIKEFLEKLEEDFEALKKFLEEHPEMDSIVREYVKDQEILPAVKDLRYKYTAIMDVLREYNEKIEEMEMFFERYRNYRYYVMEEEQIIRLVGRLFEDEERVVFRMVLARKPFSEEFVKKVGGEMVDSFTIEIPGELSPLAVERFLTEYPDSGFSIESGKYNVIYKPEQGIVKVEFTSVGYIPHVDSIVKGLGGTLLNL